MSMNEKRALITGIHGFTGQYMAAELSAAGYRVFGMGMMAAEQADYVQADLTDVVSINAAIEMIKPQVVVHLAALAFVGHSNPSAFYDVNIVGTRNLLAALAQCSVQPECILLASSANVYGNRTEGTLTEDTLPDPANDYAVSKLSMEYMARLWMDKLPIVIVRPFNYTGVGQAENFLLPKIVKHFREKAAVIELGNIEVWRDFSDVRALVNAYRRLIEVKPAGQTVNVCSGQVYSLNEVIQLCEKITSHSIKVQVNPAFVRQNEVKTLCGSASKLKSLIGDWSTPSLEETLRWMIKD